MVIDTNFGIANYYKIFATPSMSYQVNPITNLMYGVTASRVYAQTVARKMQSTVSSYLSSMSTITNELKSSAKQLSSKSSDSTFDKKTVLTSDSSSITGTAAPNADIASYTLNVSKLAKAQTNNGSWLDSDAATSFTTGTNSFTLKLGAIERNFSFNIDVNDTNKTSLDKMAKSINSSKIGITASVFSNNSGFSYLSVTSDKTGTASSFTLEDKLGNAVSASGISNISTQAQDAEYTLNGLNYSTQDNTISINNGKVKITFNKAEGKDIKFSVGVDKASIKEDINDLVGSYNDKINFANSSASNISGATNLKNEISGIAYTKSNSLHNIGISVNENGTLSVDDKKLSEAIDNNLASVKNVFSGYNGMADKVYFKANEIISAPLKYSKPNSLDNNFAGIYNNLPNLGNVMYPQGLYSGMLVDLTL